MPDPFFNNTRYEGLGVWARWRHANGSTLVYIVAWSLGATQAFCVLGFHKIGELCGGNHSTAWLPVNQLQQILEEQTK